ncbi:nuclear transport factor 2 family protein [Nocardioides aequoreus]|uniref:nuclear transport factor 2 family protein n=1 Tax=Nocardioides aequoreus TaxID=397278 RepID=UPI00055E2590|nr:nuclear transport factor 2 family protein [Nocardioides aequoreus]
MDLVDAERHLQAAQCRGDLEALEALLHPRVVGAGPDGVLFSKADDLDAYRSGSLRILQLEEEAVTVRNDGKTGETDLIATVVAIHHGTETVARLRYTRLWVQEESRWRVIAATFAPHAAVPVAGPDVVDA